MNEYVNSHTFQHSQIDLPAHPQPHLGLRTPHMLKLEAVDYNLNQDYSTWGEVFSVDQGQNVLGKRGNEFSFANWNRQLCNNFSGTSWVQWPVGKATSYRGLFSA